MSNRKQQRKFINTDHVSKHLYCVICEEIFYKPKRTECGHTFCSLCIIDWIKRENTCPICRRKIKINMLQKDYIPTLMVEELMVQCPYYESKCSWQGINEQLKNHLKECEYSQRNNKEKEKNIKKLINVKRSKNENDIIDISDDDEDIFSQQNQQQQQQQKAILNQPSQLLINQPQSQQLNPQLNINHLLIYGSEEFKLNEEQQIIDSEDIFNTNCTPVLSQKFNSQNYSAFAQSQVSQNNQFILNSGNLNQPSLDMIHQKKKIKKTVNDEKGQQ